MFSLRWYLAGFAAAVVALVVGTILVQRYAIEHLLYQDAMTTGRNWTEYLATNVKDIQEIATGTAPSDATLASFEQGKKVGRVFLYKIFDSEGRLRFVSDESLGGKVDAEALAEHNPEAAAAVTARVAVVEVKEGSPPRRPPFYAETYVPLVVDGEVAAVIETYIDQTEKRTLFNDTLTIASLILAAIVTIAFGVPAAAWYLRLREQQRADARINYLANYDGLTGLANRSQLAKRLSRVIGSAAAARTPLAVHCIDLDRFKDLNDSLGHDAGDLVIKAVADRLRAVAGANDIVARLGGDEFAIVQVQPVDAAGVEAFAQRVIDRLAVPSWLNGHEVKVSAHIGVALAPEHGTDAGRLMKSADLALDKCKSEARGNVRLFSAALDTELDMRLKYERAIRAAIDDSGFVLYFQPQYRNAGGGLVGFEALLRLPTGDGGFIPPSTFIPIAETMGLIDRIGAWVLDQACITATAWPAHLKVSVNLSPSQFAGGNVAGILSRSLRKAGLAPQRLEVEITESLLMVDTDAILAELARIKELGVSIAMDDFGTGYSSLNYLWRFPFDKIKIDGSFIQALDADDATAQKIIRTIVALARSLGMRVMVEGVETARQANFVSMIDCDEVQGFYFGIPAPASELGPMIMSDYLRHRPVEAPIRAVG
jgi:diguanylate cyclase (GGDEF)-like protein